jgi:hypothetical protein
MAPRALRFACALGLAAASTSLKATPALATQIQVSPADGNSAYAKIESARAGDEVLIAPGTYKFRVYLQAQAPASNPIVIRAADPTNPPTWDLAGTLVENAPGSYTAGCRTAPSAQPFGETAVWTAALGVMIARARRRNRRS